MLLNPKVATLIIALCLTLQGCGGQTVAHTCRPAYAVASTDDVLSTRWHMEEEERRRCFKADPPRSSGKWLIRQP